MYYSSLTQVWKEIQIIKVNILCDIYNDFMTHGLNVLSLSFLEKCLVCLLGDNLENTSESREHTRSLHNTQKSSHPKHHAKPGEDRPAAAQLGLPPTASHLDFLSPGGAARRASRRRKLLTPRRGHVMQGWVCVSVCVMPQCSSTLFHLI